MGQRIAHRVLSRYRELAPSSSLRVFTSDNALVNEEDQNMKTNALIKGSAIVVGLSFWVALLVSGPVAGAKNFDEKPNQVLEWNQIFINTLIATNTANSSSPRVGAIVHTAIFDAYNGIEQRYSPVYVRRSAPSGASRRAAIIAAAYTALVGLFPAQKPSLDAGYATSLGAL